MSTTVLHLITGLGTGGAEWQLVRLVTAPWKDTRHIVVSMTGMGTLGGRLAASGIPVHALGMREGRPSLRALVRLVGLLRKERPAVLQTWLYHADLLGLIAGRLAGTPRLVWNLRCSEMDFTRYSRLSGWVVRVLAKASPLPFAIVHNSVAGRAAHEALGYRARRWVHIPNGFDLDSFAPDPLARADVRRELGFPPDAPLVGLIARFDPMKDHATFMAAAGRLARERSGTRFLLAGGGIDGANPVLAALIEAEGLGDKVALLGRRDDVARLTAALDLAVSSSIGEGFPNTLGEALACGVCCVATDVGDSAEIVGKNGRIVPPRDPRAMAMAMAECLDMPADCRLALESDGRRRMAERYSLPIIVERYETLYRELAGE